MTDARAKVITIACLSFGVLATTSIPFAAAAVVGLLLWTIAAQIPALTIARTVWKGRWFIAAILVVNALTVSGTVIAEAAGFYVTGEGCIAGAEQSLRLIVVLWGGTIIMLTTPLEAMMDAAERWSARRGRPIVSVGVVALNYLPLLVRSARRVRAARIVNGHDDGRGFLGGIGSASASALPLFAVALRNADALAEAMESRRYIPSSPRTPFRTVRMPRRDVAVVALVVTVTVAAFLRWI